METKIATIIFYLSKKSDHPVQLSTLENHFKTDKRKMNKCLKMIKKANLI